MYQSIFAMVYFKKLIKSLSQNLYQNLCHESMIKNFGISCLILGMCEFSQDLFIVETSFLKRFQGAMKLILLIT